MNNENRSFDFKSHILRPVNAKPDKLAGEYPEVAAAIAIIEKVCDDFPNGNEPLGVINMLAMQCRHLQEQYMQHSKASYETMLEEAERIQKMFGKPNEPERDDFHCPLCGSSGLCLNVGREHWFICEHDKVKWHVGSNLFSAWRDESPEVWEHNHKKLLEYRQVEHDSHNKESE